jgi:UDP-N-acetylglucosamine diphosphorylase/glucosamine-1-phosphate N-acetyltransferase
MRSDIRLDEQACREDLWPLTLASPVADLRMGILTIRERWEVLFGGQAVLAASGSIPAHHIPDDPGMISATAADRRSFSHLTIDRPWKIPIHNHRFIRFDFEWVTRGRVSSSIPDTVRVTGKGPVFIEPGARLEHCILNASEGPVYIGRNALVMDGACLRGPLAVCEGAVVKMGATLYGGTTVGPFCTVGGEVKNSVLMDHSNKAHHGYLGDSVIGRWCNLGAGTSGSNVRNTGGPVQVWNMQKGLFEEAGAKCGLVMGDHCRTAIDTSFNTGTVVGISSNVFGAKGLTPKFIPSFSWGVEGEVYELEKALRDMGRWMAFKDRKLDAESRAAIVELHPNNRKTT